MNDKLLKYLVSKSMAYLKWLNKTMQNDNYYTYVYLFTILPLMIYVTFINLILYFSEDFCPPCIFGLVLMWVFTYLGYLMFKKRIFGRFFRKIKEKIVRKILDKIKK